ncbi:unnamed protein product [Parajaminaea phylloscopi]
MLSSSTLNTPLNPYIEAHLYTSPSAREKWDACANLYSLTLCLDALERAYVAQAVDDSKYAPTCSRLLAQIKTSIKLVTSGSTAPSRNGPEDPPLFADIEEFMAHWGLDLPLTSHRISLGIPATLEHPGGGTSSPHSGMGGSGMGGGGSDRAKNVAETTQAFITLMDALKLNLRAKDQLHPLLGEAVSCWNRSGGWGGNASTSADEAMGGRREKLVGWLIQLNQLKASDEIDEDQARQMLFDVEGAYQAWFRSLQGG